MSLSPRLQFAFDHLIPNEDVWDFCCDHGYLGGSAYKSQKYKNIYFVDPVPSIIESLKLRFKKYVYSADSKSQAYFLQQSGQSITQKISGNVCILGVGGHLIYEIVEALSNQGVLQSQRLILGPHRDLDLLLSKVTKNENLKKYKLSHRQKIFEIHRVHEFLVFDLQSLVS